MATSKPQILTVFVHEDQKLVYVATNNNDTKIANRTLAGLTAKAKYAWGMLAAGQRNSNTERQLTGGIFIALVNTGYSGWTEHLQSGEYSQKDAVLQKKMILESYISQGYKNVGARNYLGKNGKSDKPSGWDKPFNVNYMTLKKVSEKIEWMAISLNVVIPSVLHNKALQAIIGSKATVDNMATLLLFLRKELNLP